METFSAAQRVQASLQELFEAKLAPGDPHIKFQLTSDNLVLMSMAQVEESGIIAAEKITPLPNMPESVIGMMSSRDRVFCIYDLAKLLNLPSPLINLRKYQIVVLEVSKILHLDRTLYLGFAVQELQGIMRFSREDIKSSQNLKIDIETDYLLGYIIPNQQPIPILNPQTILDNSIAQINEK